MIDYASVFTLEKQLDEYLSRPIHGYLENLNMNENFKVYTYVRRP